MRLLNDVDHLCRIDGCDGQVLARGWCGKHYQRWKKHGDPSYERSSKDWDAPVRMCTSCDQEKPRDQFRSQQSWCRECLAAHQMRRMDLFRDIIREAKSAPCLDCGVFYPYYVMDLDHRSGEAKVAKLSSYWKFSSEKKLRSEIEKCDLVCANCHRIRTHERSSGF